MIERDGRDRFPDEDDMYGDKSTPPRPRKPTNPALVLGLVLGGVLLLVVLICGTFAAMFFMRMDHQARQAAAESAMVETAPPVRPDNAPGGQVRPMGKGPGARPVPYSRKDFEAKVRGKGRSNGRGGWAR